MSEPRVSILMSVYNESINQLDYSIKSMLNQTMKDFEFIIVNDNPSRVDMRDYLNKIGSKDSRIKIVTNEMNMGLPTSLNNGLEYCNTAYIVRMDADDYSAPQRLEIEYQFISDNNYDVVGSDFSIMDENGKTINEKGSKFVNQNITYELRFNNVIHHPTVIMKKESVTKVGGYRNIKYAEDYDLWLRMLDDGATFYVIKENLFKYRFHESSVSRSNTIEQMITILYLKDLMIERNKLGKDSFTQKNHMNYISDFMKNKDIKMSKIKYIESQKKFEEADKELDNNNKLKALYIRLSIFIKDRFLREFYIYKKRQNNKINNVIRKGKIA